jgi:hypothetical protein
VNGYECRDIEKSERSSGPRFQAPMEIEVDTPATERIKARKNDLRTGPKVSGVSQRSEWRTLRDHIERRNI